MKTESASARENRNIARRALAAARLGVDHSVVALSVYDNGGLTGRYLMMTVISAAIAALGLMLGSPAVVIGAMLVSLILAVFSIRYLVNQVIVGVVVNDATSSSSGWSASRGCNYDSPI